MILVKDLSKYFRHTKAIDKVSFSIKSGKAVALWGSNGAGKTTVLRCLLGILPFDGEIRIANHDVRQSSKAIRQMIGFVPQEICLHDRLNIHQTMRFYAQLKKASSHTIDSWLTMLGLKQHISKTVKELSGGMKQRLALAIALLADPPVLMLDEPTANLDMHSRDDFLKLLEDLKNNGKTIIFCSHRLEEVLLFADRILWLDQGRLITDGRADKIYEHLEKQSLRFRSLKNKPQHHREHREKPEFIKISLAD